MEQETTFTLDNDMDAINKFCADDKALVSNPIQPDSFLQSKFTDKILRPFWYYRYGDTVVAIIAAFSDAISVNITANLTKILILITTQMLQKYTFEISK